jgi:hypothetical protein
MTVTRDKSQAALLDRLEEANTLIAHILEDVPCGGRVQRSRTALAISRNLFREMTRLRDLIQAH